MLGVDTNILVRLVLRDDARQARAAEKTVQAAVSRGETVLVSLLTMLETEWVLRSSAQRTKPEILRAFKVLLETRDFQFEHENVLEQALYDFENSNADFADCLMIASYLSAGCRTMLTFDGKAAKLEGAELLPA